MEAEGVKFVTNTNVGVDITAEELLKKFDRVILCCGASNPRDIKVPGRDARVIYFAVDFLKKVTKTLLDSDFTKAPYEEARGKHVLVISTPTFVFVTNFTPSASISFSLLSITDFSSFIFGMP